MSGLTFMRKAEKLKTRKITLRPSARQLRMDSEKYRLKALELGASDAKIIPQLSMNRSCRDSKVH